MTQRPRVTNPARPADQYADQSRERIIEFIDPVTQLGGLISFYRTAANELLVQVYRCDAGVTVVGPTP